VNTARPRPPLPRTEEVGRGGGVKDGKGAGISGLEGFLGGGEGNGGGEMGDLV